MEEFFTESYSGRLIRKVFYHSGTRVPTSSVTNATGVSGTLLSCWSRLKTLLTEIFLPQGYPSSVSDDYMQYQRWDTLQAFASSLTGALATEAVLKGAGVGDQSASTLAASLTWLTKDGLGMIGRSELDCDCKKWRFVADIFNDLAFFIDLISPALNGSFFICACTSSILRSVVGVAGGATRTAIVQHQVQSCTAMFSSRRFVLIGGYVLVEITLLMLRQRMAAKKRSWLSYGKVLSVRECNTTEPLFSSFGKRYLGCSLFDLLSYHRRVPFSRLVTKNSYTLLFDTSRHIGWIAMADGGCNYSALNALFDLEALAKKETPSNDFITFMDELRKHGWEVNTSNLGFDEWVYSTK
uniref:UPF0420 protein n=1 Tax=Angiostrongylus cantonensis TaxID=6313 RepID=A0A0K0DJ89_ANGCA